MQFLEISSDFGILGFSKILGFFQRFFGIFWEVYEDFQSNLPLATSPPPPPQLYMLATALGTLHYMPVKIVSIITKLRSIGPFRAKAPEII